MAQYTPITPQEIQQLAQQYKITVKNYAALEGGMANSSFLLDAVSGQYILTIAEERSYKGARLIASLLDHLAKYRFPASRLVAAGSGEKVTRFQGKGVLIKHFIPGETISQISDEGLFDLGQALAQLHTVPPPDFLPDELPYGEAFFDNAYGIGVDQSYEDWLACQQAYFIDHDLDHLSKSIVHGDVFWDNIIFLDGEFQALIDFDDACCYFSIYDLANAISGACIQEDGTLDLAKAAQVVAGYQNIRRLSPAEKTALHLFTHYSVVAISFWRYMKYNVHNPIAEKKYLYQEKVALAEHIKAIPPAEFNQVFNQLT
jgi:homoserine kinase type II